jgi:hypothetical protein
MSSACRFSATTMYENGIGFDYAVRQDVWPRGLQPYWCFLEPADEFDPGRAWAQRTVASS